MRRDISKNINDLIFLIVGGLVILTAGCGERSAMTKAGEKNQSGSNISESDDDSLSLDRRRPVKQKSRPKGPKNTPETRVGQKIYDFNNSLRYQCRSVFITIRSEDNRLLNYLVWEEAEGPSNVNGVQRSVWKDLQAFVGKKISDGDAGFKGVLEIGLDGNEFRYRQHGKEIPVGYYEEFPYKSQPSPTPLCPTQ